MGRLETLMKSEFEAHWTCSFARLRTPLASPLWFSAVFLQLNGYAHRRHTLASVTASLFDLPDKGVVRAR
jgi:hypothetical protein